MRIFDRTHHPHPSLLQLEAAPHVGDVMVEIGLVVAVHLAFALAVAFTLNAFGIS